MTDPSFAEVEGSNVSIACSKLRRRFGNFDPGDLHADQFHLGKLVLADDGEMSALGAGRPRAIADPPPAPPSTRAPRPELLRQPPPPRPPKKPMLIPARTEGMISRAAVVVAEFGNGAEGKLLERASAGFEEQVQPQARAPPAGHRADDQDDRGRLQGQGHGPEDGRDRRGWQAVITSCVRAMERFPLYQQALGGMVLDASANFPDLTPAPGGRPREGR